MNELGRIIYIAVSALVIENLVFARGLGVDEIVPRTRTYDRITRFGVVVMATTTLSGVLSWILSFFFSHYQIWNSIRFFVLFLSVVASYIAVRFALMALSKTQSESLDEFVSSAAFNGAVFGAVLLAIGDRMGLLGTVVYCVFGAAGLVLAMFLIHSGRERMEISNVPKAFAGLPITLLYIGILSLAIYGLIGHQLPT